MTFRTYLNRWALPFHFEAEQCDFGKAICYSFSFLCFQLTLYRYEADKKPSLEKRVFDALEKQIRRNLTVRERESIIKLFLLQ